MRSCCIRVSEFIESGYAGTDTNRIARRAGFAPQTFYRWFADKTAILIEVLHVWEEVEQAVVQALFEDRDTPALQLAEACVENIRPFLTFRLWPARIPRFGKPEWPGGSV